MRTLAKEYGMSDVGLAKICRKHDIPIPPVGYWRRKETGQNVARPPLQAPKNGTETLDIYVRERLNPEFAALAAEESPKVVISEELSHALVTRTEKLLSSGKENEKKLIVPRKGAASHLLVSREQLPRALRIMNALFVAHEERTQVVSWSKEEGAPLVVSVDGEAVMFCLQELTDSVPHVLPPAEGKHPWRAPKWDYKLTGRLQFRIGNLPHSSGSVRGSWSDGKIQRLENCIGDFVVGLKVAAAAIKKNRLDNEEWSRRYEEERKKREEEQQRAEEHKRKAEFVTELMRNWEEAQCVRTFVKALAECAGQLELTDEERSDIQQVVDWTREYAEFLDPFSDLPDSIDEFVHPEKRYPWLNL